MADNNPATDGSVIISIEGDSKKLDQALSSATQTINTITAGWDSTATAAATNVENAAANALSAATRTRNTLGGLNLNGKKSVDELAKEAAQTRASATSVAQAAGDAIEAVADAGEQAQESVQDVGDSVKDFLGGFGKGVTETILGVFTAAKVANVVSDFAKESIQLASALGEVQNVVNVTFGDAGASRINRWSMDAARSFGLTELQAKTYSSTVGAMMKEALEGTDADIVAISENITGLAADIASFYNLDFDTAFNKLFSGLNGQIIPLRSIGIDVSVDALTRYAESMDKVWKDMSSGEKALLRYQYLMDKTTDAQGDFARTSDGYANSMRQIETILTDIKIQFGEVLLPFITSFAQGIQTVLGWFLPGVGTFEEKVKDIQKSAEVEKSAIDGTANSAQTLAGVLQKLNDENGGDFMAAYAKDSERLSSAYNTWVTACDQLIEKIPGLNQIINAQTGEINGGIEAIGKYIESWRVMSKRNAVEAALNAYKSEFEAEWGDMALLEGQAGIAEIKAQNTREQFEALGGQEELTRLGNLYSAAYHGTSDEDRDIVKRFSELEAISRTLNKQEQDAEAKRAEFDKYKSQYEIALSEYEEYYNSAMEYLDQSEEAYNNSYATGEGVADGLNAAIPDVTAAADAIVAESNRAAGAADSVGVGSSGGDYAGHAAGLDYVPRDNYLAYLHAGEGVLTAQENQMWRNFKYGDMPNDYGAMGGAISAGMGNMQIVWRGRVVADVLSGMQGDQYRALERSGWRS